MNEKNFEYLRDQIKYTGFGEALENDLKETLAKGQAQFSLTHQQSYGSDTATALLHFRKGTGSDIYFFNRYELSLQNDRLTEPLKQSFYINARQDNVTLKEGYNLLSGRAVQKELTNKEGEKYTAWIQLDFKQTEANGNFRVKQFHSNYGFDLEKELQKLSPKELRTEEARNSLLTSLQRGNRQAVMLEDGNKKLFIEAAPQYKTINIYDGSGQRIKAEQKGTKQEQIPAQDQKADKKVNQVNAGKKQNRSKRPKQPL